MEYLFTNGRIITMGESGRGPEAVLVRDNVILGLGSESELKLLAKSTPVIIDLKGKLLLPAFTDSHTHFVEYAKRRLLVDLSSCKTMGEIRQRIRDYIDVYGDKAEWIAGSGWDKNILDAPKLINKKFLDDICRDRPIVFQSKDFHTKWCNSKALSLAGITQNTPVPSGGIIGIDLKTGLPDGMLYDESAPLIDSYVRLSGTELIIKAIQDTIEEAWQLGLTGSHLMESGHNWELAKLAVTDKHPFHLCWHFPYAELDHIIDQGILSYTGDEMFKFGGVKIFTDGALGSQSAWMFEPYSDSASYGLMRYQEEELTGMIRKAAMKGISSSIHAIGNRANHVVVKALLSIKDVSAGLLPRIEHVQCIRQEDIRLLKESGAYASMQPVHLANDIPMIEKYWGGLEKQVYPFADIINTGIPYCFGSDVPVETNNPFAGIYTAIKRKSFDKSKAGSSASWQPSQCLNLQQALYGYTTGAAASSKSEQVRGSIQAGKLADLIITDNFLEDTEALLETGSNLTMINGIIVFSK